MTPATTADPAGFPFSFVVMTFNLWGDHRIPERSAALRSLMEIRAPDVLAVQELRRPTRDLIDESLSTHRRVDDPFPGWEQEGNIWWRDELFALEDYGAEDVGIRAEYARLFWVRLRVNALPESGPLVVGAAHLTWPGHPQEWEDDVNPRVQQARRVAAALRRLAADGPCLFARDVNDWARPLWVLRCCVRPASGTPFSHSVVARR